MIIAMSNLSYIHIQNARQVQLYFFFVSTTGINMKPEERLKYYQDMRKNILTSMIIVPLLPFLLVLAIGYYYFTASIQDTTISRMVRTLRDHHQMIESFLMERKEDLRFIQNACTFEELSQPAELKRIFQFLQQKSDTFVDLGIFNADGLHLAYEGPFRLAGKVYQKEKWFIEVMKKGYFVSDVFLGFRNVPHFIIAVARKENDRKWVLRATIDTYKFNQLVKSVRIGKTGEAYLLNSDGIFQTERRSGGNLMTEDLDFPSYPSIQKEIQTFIRNDFRKDKYLYATKGMKDNQWILVIRQEKADAFKALRNTVYLGILIILIGLAVIGFLAFFLTERIIKQMKSMDTEKGQLQQQLISATRLAELGEMAAGFAHEINNPLQIIKSEQALIAMILDDFKEKGPLKDIDEAAVSEIADLEDSMHQIRLQIERCAKITQAILKFGRQSEPVTEPISLQDFIPEIIEMVNKKASVHGLTIEKQIQDDMPSILGDPAQLQQVLLNLLNNAIDAVLERHGAAGGLLIIRARIAENGKVEIAVQDNGSGISPENQKKIFSPFFTTKPVGKGTGLGLSVCYGIIDSMGGAMTVSSEKNVGTTFTIRLPAVSHAAEN
jgi:two-component system NtrC family sensor kinase